MQLTTKIRIAAVAIFVFSLAVTLRPWVMRPKETELAGYIIDPITGEKVKLPFIDLASIVELATAASPPPPSPPPSPPPPPPTPPAPPPPGDADLNSIDDVGPIMGDVEEESVLQQAAQFRSYKGEIILLVAGRSDADLAVNAAYHLEKDWGFGHYLLVLTDRDLCTEAADATAVTCVWSTFMAPGHPAWVGLSLPPGGEEGLRVHALRSHLLVRLHAKGLNVLSIDGDARVLANPYELFKRTLWKANLFVAGNITDPPRPALPSMSGFVVYFQGAAANGQVQWLLQEVLDRLLWALQTQGWRNKLGKMVKREELTSWQDIFADVLETSLLGYEIHRHQFKEPLSAEELTRLANVTQNASAGAHTPLRWPPFRTNTPDVMVQGPPAWVTTSLQWAHHWRVQRDQGNSLPTIVLSSACHPLWLRWLLKAHGWWNYAASRMSAAMTPSTGPRAAAVHGPFSAGAFVLTPGTTAMRSLPRLQGATAGSSGGYRGVGWAGHGFRDGPNRVEGVSRVLMLSGFHPRRRSAWVEGVNRFLEIAALVHRTPVLPPVPCESVEVFEGIDAWPEVVAQLGNDVWLPGEKITTGTHEGGYVCYANPASFLGQYARCSEPLVLHPYLARTPQFLYQFPANKFKPARITHIGQMGMRGTRAGTMAARRLGRAQAVQMPTRSLHAGDVVTAAVVKSAFKDVQSAAGVYLDASTGLPQVKSHLAEDLQRIEAMRGRCRVIMHGKSSEEDD
eukprot:jgi/Mesvir1/16107/Mv08395-RA.1